MIVITSIVSAFMIMFLGVPTPTQATQRCYVCTYDYDRYVASWYQALARVQLFLISSKKSLKFKLFSPNTVL